MTAPIALQDFVDGEEPTVDADWLNAIDVLWFTALGGAQTTGQVQSVLGIALPLAIASGGTGAITAAAAATALGVGTGNSPQFTAVNVGDAIDTTLARAAAGRLLVETVPIVRGPASATDNAVVRFDGTTGDLTQTSAFLVSDTGNVSSFGGQITFPSTQSASSDPNTLDDYEEGTFTGTFTGFSAGITRAVRYTKVGKNVTITFPEPRVDGTSNATTKTMTGIPADLRPSDTFYTQSIVSDNGGAIVSGFTSVGSGGTITFFSNIAGSAWTGSGTAIIYPPNISWSI